MNPNTLLPAIDEATREKIEAAAQDLKRALAYFNCAMMEIETKFKVLDQEFQLAHDRNPIADIRTRLKSIPSIQEKLARMGLPFDVDTMVENLSDVAGVRVICTFPEDVYLLADALLRQDDIKLIQRKDYIETPKPNGYRSLHLIVEIPIFLSNRTVPMKVEIQLRTIAMDFWASLEHQLKYKKGLDDAAALTAELKDCADKSAELDLRMQQIRRHLENTQPRNR